MNARILVGIAALSVGLSSCNSLGSKEAECAGEDATAVVASIVSEQILKAAQQQAVWSDGGSMASESKIRATVALIKTAIEDVRTTKADPDSTKKFCAGTLNVTLPLSLISDADKAREAVDLSSVSEFAAESGLERSADVFSYPIEYSVQPTDDGTSIFGELENPGEQFTFFGELVASHLALGSIQSQQAASAAQAAASKLEAEKNAAEQALASRDLAKAENDLATQTINEIWNNIDSELRSQLLPMQRAWIKKKETDCNIESAEISLESVARETARLKCDTELTRQRSSELREYL